MLRPLAAALLLVFGVSSCSSFSKTSRDQRAYEKYLRKTSASRTKQRNTLKSKTTEMPKMPPATSPESSTTASSPETP